MCVLCCILVGTTLGDVWTVFTLVGNRLGDVWTVLYTGWN